LTAFATPEDYQLIVKNIGPPEKNWPGYERDIVKIRKERQCLIYPNPNRVNSFAMPVIDSRKHLLGAIGCYSPAFRCGQQLKEKILTVLRQAVMEIAELQYNE
jgi:DNA-binding IclR family transcriptional regulator